MELIGLHPRTQFAEAPEGRVLVAHPWGTHSVRGDHMRLSRLVDEPVEPSSLDADAMRFLATLPFLVVHTFVEDGVQLLRMVPLGLAARPVEPVMDSAVRLSRFALLRGENGVLVLESPLSLYRAELDPSLGGAVTSLVRPRAINEFSGVERQVVRELVAAGLVGCEQDESLRTWEFHDLLFHTRSSAGRHDQVVGGAYLHEADAVPAVKPMSGPALVLPKPFFERDMSFKTVLESRRSTRSYGKHGLSFDELGELLFRAARIRSVLADGTTSRPYPSAGAAYDLEIYLAVRRCRGLDRGVYHYDPLEHALRLVNPELGELARMPAGFAESPDVRLVITSRFRRVSAKYSSLAYALVLRNVGALFQTLYLVATSMGLAACAIGTGDIAATERVLGEPFTEESVVGEFALGSLGV